MSEVLRDFPEVSAPLKCVNFVNCVKEAVGICSIVSFLGIQIRSLASGTVTGDYDKQDAMLFSITIPERTARSDSSQISSHF